MNGGPENKLLIKELYERYGINRIVVSSYHLEANGIIERRHKSIKDALLKRSSGGTN
jgi:hypothetical protein